MIFGEQRDTLVPYKSFHPETFYTYVWIVSPDLKLLPKFSAERAKCAICIKIYALFLSCVDLIKILDFP